MRYLFSIAIVLAAAVSSAFAQGTSVNEIVDRAAAQSKVYLETFKNLLSEEKKTFEIFDKNGKEKKRKTIESTFLVYQLSKGSGEVAEFRNVTAVDGKKIDNVDGRAQDFFEKVSKSGTSSKELDDIREESSRYDADFSVDGFTLYQAIPLRDRVRSSFEFVLVGSESIDGREYFVIRYEQKTDHPLITVNSTVPVADKLESSNYDIDIEGDKKAVLNSRMRGSFWIDPVNFNIRKEVRERTIQPEGYASPLVVARNTFEYGDSEFSILTPTKIVHTQSRIDLKDKTDRPDIAVTFSYGKFTEPNVEVKSGEVTTKN